MAVTLVVGTNTYIDLADAETYLEGSINTSAWDAKSTDEKNRLLVSATRYLDRQDWVGEKTSDVQALDWPRTGVTDPDGNAVDDSTVPQFILNAECELAAAMAADSSIQESSSTGSDVKRLKADTVEIEYFSTTIGGTRFPTIVQELVGFYLEGSDSGFTDQYYGGTDYESGLNDHDLTRGI